MARSQQAGGRLQWTKTEQQVLERDHRDSLAGDFRVPGTKERPLILSFGGENLRQMTGRRRASDLFRKLVPEASPGSEEGRSCNWAALSIRMPAFHGCLSAFVAVSHPPSKHANSKALSFLLERFLRLIHLRHVTIRILPSDRDGLAELFGRQGSGD